jgi:hypothetical protein
MKSLLLLGLFVLSTFSQSHACELLVKDVKLTEQERQGFESKGFRINEIQNFSKTDAGKLALVGKYTTNGAGILWFDLSKEVYKIAKFWDYSDEQLKGRLAIKYLDYVAKSKSLNSIESCDDLVSSLDKMIYKIGRTQMYPRHDDNHGVIFLKD